MTYRLKISFTLLFATIIFSCRETGNRATTVEKTFKVWGNCEQCKATIEEACKLAGIKNMDWNEDTKLLKFKIDTSEISVSAVLKSVAEAGYDNELYPANDKAYSELPECCQYDRKPASN